MPSSSSWLDSWETNKVLDELQEAKEQLGDVARREIKRRLSELYDFNTRVTLEISVGIKLFVGGKQVEKIPEVIYQVMDWYEEVTGCFFPDWRYEK